MNELKILFQNLIQLMTFQFSSGTTNITSTQALEFENWDKIAGNSKEFTYYAGSVEPGNPGGNSGLTKEIFFKKDGVLVLTQTIAYDNVPAIISITAS